MKVISIVFREGLEFDYNKRSCFQLYDDFVEKYQFNEGERVVGVGLGNWELE